VSYAALHGVLDGVAWALLMTSIGLYISLVLSQNVSFPQHIPRTAALAGITKRRWMRRPIGFGHNLGLPGLMVISSHSTPFSTQQ